MKKILSLFIAALSILFLFTACSKKLEIQNGDKITISYDSFGQDGKIIEKDQKTTFVIGLQQSFPIFEQELLGMKVGEKKEFVASSELGYSIQHDNGQIQHLNSLIFEKTNTEIITGEIVSFGEMKGKILEIRGNTVVVDFNESYINESVTFIVKITNIERN